MNLPEFERVIYKHNPLIEVVCQLRFPPILKISHQEPVEFQDEIRSQYPLFEVTQPPIPSEFIKLSQQAGLSLPNQLSYSSYSFKSEDQEWQISLTKDFISISTSAYERYEEFKQRLKRVVDIFERIYQPSFYTRTGLRYQDLIVRSDLKLEDKKWSDLIAKRIGSELHDSELSTSIQTITKNLVLKVGDGQVNFNHGLVILEDSKKDSNETAYLLDADFYTEQKVENNGKVWNILDQFNQSAGRLFRWSITDALHKAMQPQAVSTTE